MITCDNKNKGFTLVELMIAIVIATIVTAGIYTAYASQVRSYTTQNVVVEMQQNIRNSMYYIQGSIRMAGLDPQGSGLMGFVANFDSPYDTFGATTDATNIAFTVDANQDGALDPNDLEHVAYRLDNTTSELQRFFINPSPPPPPNDGWVTIAENIDALNFVYLDSADPPNVLAPPLSAADLAAIRSVQVTIVARAGQNPHPSAAKTTDNKIYRNQQGTPVFIPGGDKFIRNHLTLQVNCRNLNL